MSDTRPILFLRSYVAAHQRRLKNGQVVQVGAHYDKRVRRGTEHAPGHGHDTAHLDEKGRDLFRRMHEEQHLLHHYHGHALRSRIATLEAAHKVHEAEAQTHRAAGRHKEATRAANRALKLQARLHRHRRELADVEHKVRGIAEMKERLAPGSGAVETSTDASHAGYVAKMGPKWKPAAEKPGAPEQNDDGARTDFNVLVDQALTENDPKQTLIFRNVSSKEIDDVKRQSGLDISGMVHEFSAEALRHAMRQHGDAAREAARIPKQRQLTRQDLLRLPEVIDNYDSIQVQRREKNKSSLVYRKKFEDGETVYVERVIESSAKNKPRLTTKSVWVVAATGVEPSPAPVSTRDHAGSIADDQEGGHTAPKDGDTKPGADGGTLVFRDGRWHRQEEGKATGEAKGAPALAASDDPNSPNYRFRDTGVIEGARKFDVTDDFRQAVKAGQLMRQANIDWEAVEANPRRARELVTKSNLFGKVDWEALKAGGMDPGAGFLIDRVYASIAPEPEDNPVKRRDYALGIESVRDRMESCKTPDEVMATLREMREERAGTILSARESDEYKALMEQLGRMQAEHQEIQRQKDALFQNSSAAAAEVSHLKYQQRKRTDRGWKPDPEIDKQIAAAQPAADKAQQAMNEFLAANPRLQGVRRDLGNGWGAYDNDYEWEMRKVRDRAEAIRRDAAATNLLTNPNTRAWQALGERFDTLLNNRSESFAGHRSNVRSGKVADWSWAEKDAAIPKTTQREAQFQLQVADSIERKGGREVTAGSTEALKAQFGLRDVQSGNWVLKDPASAQWHVQRAAEAFTDLADLIGADPKRIAMNGRLALAFGARGTGNAGFGGAARAHYEPVERVVNITKMQGGGTLAHEWFHALDNLIGAAHGGPPMSDAFATENDAVLAALPREVADAFRDLRGAMLDGVHRATRTIPITQADRRTAERYLGQFPAGLGTEIKAAGSLDAAIRIIDKREEAERARKAQFGKKLSPKSKQSYELWRGAAAAHYSPPGIVQADIKTGPAMSRFALEAQHLDGKRAKPYWGQPTEMAARAFQSWVEDRLGDRGQRNDYLSAKADNRHYPDLNPFTGKPFKPFPEAEERTQINRAFDRLFAAMRQHATLEKALALMGRPGERPVVFLKAYVGARSPRVSSQGV